MASDDTGDCDATGDRGATVDCSVADKRCPRCGAGFRCGREPGNASCWCAALPNVLPVPAGDAGVGCLCPDCLSAAVGAARVRLVPPGRSQ